MTRRRRGFTLIEMLVVMTTTAVLLGLCAALIHALLRVERAGRVHVADATTVGRLARQFRDDVRAATVAEPGDGAAGPIRRVELVAPSDRRIEYRVEAGALVRAVRVAGKAGPQERFRLPARGSARLEVEGPDGGGPTIVRLVLDREPARGGGALRDLRIEGALGQDHRFGDRGVAR